MKNQVIPLDKELGREIAKEYFMEMCGYKKNKIVPLKKLQNSLKTLEDIYDKLYIQAIISEYDNSCISASTMVLDGEEFTCKALSQIPSREIEKVYIYLMTTGELEYGEASVLNEVYYDMWQTAYIYAGKEILRQYLQNLHNNKKKYVSDSFGPGFYGMEVSQLKQFFAVLDGKKIQMKLLESGFMLPMKSYAGFITVTNSANNIPSKDCENCLSVGKTCMYCKGKSEIVLC